MSYVWILNPDAETEIASGGDYTAPLARQRQMAARRAQFEPLVSGEEAYFVHELVGQQTGEGKVALFWCPTRSACRAAERAGYSTRPAPTEPVLRRVLSREFLVGSALPAPRGRTFVRTEEHLHAEVARLGPGVALRTKRAFGCAGRGQRSLRERLVKDDAQFLRDGLALGGLLIEPELTISREFSLHGLLLPGQTALLGAPCALSVDEHGQPTAIERCESSPETTRDLRTLAERTASVLDAAGYFGPFGIDVLEVGEGALYVSDLNARFTLGWSTGMGDLRELALRHLLAHV